MKRSLSKVFLMLLSSMSLIACANDLDIQEEVGVQPTSLDETTQAVGKSLSHSTIQEELAYIEMLVGVEELHAAKVALNGFLSELNGPVGTEEQLIRISQLKDVLSEVEVSEDGTHNHTFTAVDAVALAMERYGTDDEDIIYMYDDSFRDIIFISFFLLYNNNFFFHISSLSLLFCIIFYVLFI